MGKEKFLMNWPDAMRKTFKTIENQNLAWLDARISETQQLIVIQKRDLAESENKGLNAGIPCRNIAAMTERLNFLEVRRAAVLRRESLMSSGRILHGRS